MPGGNRSSHRTALEGLLRISLGYSPRHTLTPCGKDGISATHNKGSLEPSCKTWLFLYQIVHWGFGVGDLEFWGFRVGREVDLVVGGLGLKGQGWIELAQRVGKYPVVNAFSRD